ncbi:MAG: hypothetical protein JWR82_246 [Blastococcus sp.]|jgi:MFS family permease|nr:hypothetical protein [Blastococcus sp.]
MPANSWWQGLDAERWVYRVGLVETTLLIIATLAVAVLGLGQGVVWVALLPGSLAALSGWLTVAWRRGRTWPWWVWIVLVGTGTPPALGDLVSGPSAWNAVVLAIDLGVLLLLCHPRSRARIHGPVPPLPTTAEYALTGRR